MPSRSSSSVCGIGVDCGGVNGNTKTSAASTVAVPGQQPAARDDVDRGPDRDTGPSVAPRAVTVCGLRRIRLDDFELHARDGRDREFDADDPRRLRRRPHRQSRLLGFEAALRAGLAVHLDRRHRPLPADRAQHAEQRRREGDQLPPCADHARRPAQPPRRSRSPASMAMRASVTRLRRYESRDHPRPAVGSRHRQAAAAVPPTTSAPCTLSHPHLRPQA